MDKFATVASGRLYRADFPEKVDGDGKVTRKAFSRVVLIDENSANRYSLAEDKDILDLVSSDNEYRVFVSGVKLELASDPTTGEVKAPRPKEADGITLVWHTARVDSVDGVELRDPWQGNALTNAIKAQVAQRQ